MRKRNHKYRPKVQTQIGHLLDEGRRNDEKLAKLQAIIEASEKSHGIYMAALANFMGHDIKNCIQSMDAVLAANSADEFTQEHIDSLQQQINIIRQAINNFSETLPNAAQSSFKIHSLIGTAESLIRHMCREHQIQFSKELPTDMELSVSTHYHSLLQILYNLLINAISHLKTHSQAYILLKVALDMDKQELYLAVYDNGKMPDAELIEKIFEFGFSTTGGSGIGLFHARYVCELNQGSLNCLPSDKQTYTKRFLVTLPIKVLNHE